jgi:hypothetical protein
MPAGSHRGRPPIQKVKKMCGRKGCPNPAISGKKLCKSCTRLSPEVRNSPHPKHPRAD